MSRFWKEIDSIEFESFEECAAEFKKNYKSSPWVDDILKKNSFQFDRSAFPIRLLRKKVREFGFDLPTELHEIYREIETAGFQLVPPEIAIYSRKLYADQPTGEWLRFATPLDAMIDSDGVPHLLKLGAALGSHFIETYWAYKNAIFYPDNEFVVVEK